MMLPATVLNVDGAIGSTFNVNGIRARQIFELAQQGKIDEAFKIQNITNDLITDILGNGLYQTIKYLLQLQGVDAGYCKKPMSIITEGQKEKAKEMYEKYLKSI